MRDANKYLAARLCCLHHFGKQTRRLLYMLKNLEGANGVISAGMRDEVLAQRLAADFYGLPVFGHMGIEPGVIGMRHTCFEIAKPATDIEDAGPRGDGPRGHCKFAANGFLRKKTQTFDSRVELGVEGAVTF